VADPDDTDGEPCKHEHAEDSCDGEHHRCPDCGGDVPCAEMGPDLCGFEAAKADRTTEIVEFLRGRSGDNAHYFANLVEREFGQS
jgi:hypothetical protein